MKKSSELPSSFFEIEYIKDSQRHKTVVLSQHKVEAIKEFKNHGLGVFVNINQIKEPTSYKIEKIKNKIKDILRAKKVPLEPYIATLRHISTMLNAGLPITICLEDVLKTTEHKRIKEIFTSIAQEVESGISLSLAFERFESEVGSISIALIDLGEKQEAWMSP